MRHIVVIAACVLSGVAVAADPGSKPQATPSKNVAAPAEGQTPIGASAQLMPTQGNSAKGTLSLTTDKSGVRIAGLVEGLKPNSEHGFHVHEKGDCSAPDATSAGAHFNPTSRPHGNPNAGTAKHLGDMVNLKTDAKGIAKVDMVVDGATLHTGQPSDLVGRAVIVHQQPDDYTTQPSGNAGGRVACGVITSR
jgi:superoxide dismutase, Cu-Zn family